MSRGARGIIKAALAAVFVTVAFPRALAGQEFDLSRKITQYRVRVWSDEEGLPQNSVLAVLQLRDGTVLAGTENGLALFDGSKLAPPVLGPLAKVGPVWVNRFLEDSDGTVWIATRDHGLIRVAQGGLTVFGASDGLRGESVESLYRDADGRLWIGTSDAGLYRLDGNRAVAAPLGDAPGSEFVQAISADSRGQMVVGTRGGLFVGQPGRWVRFSQADGLPDDHVYTLSPSYSDTVWVGTAKGLAVFIGGVVRPTPSWVKSAAAVRAIRRDNHGAIWLGTNGGGLYRLYRGKTEALNSDNGFPSNLVWSLAGDDEGGLWAGTNGGGLVRLDDPPVSVFGKSEGLSSDIALATLQGADGTMWVGTAGGGLNAIRGGVVRRLTTADGLTTNIVTALREDKNGDLWIGTAPSGLHLLRAGRLTRIDMGAAFRNVGINTIHVDKGGRVWVGSEGAGLAVRDGNRWKSVQAPGSLPSNFVKAIAADSSGTIYVGTRGGVVAFRGTQLIRLPVFPDPLKNTITALHATPSGSIWLGSYHSGLGRLSAGRLVHIGEDRGLPREGVNGILEDSRGTVWVTTNKGIFAVSRAQLDEVADGKRAHVNGYSIGKAEGMRSRETNGGIDPPGWVAKDGGIWIPTLGGVVTVDADRLSRAPKPRVSVTGLIVGDSLIPVQPGLRLPAETPRLSIAFRVLTFASPDALLVEYRLKGVDPDWVDAGTSRLAQYTTLPKGPHQFEVRARHRLGTWGAPATIAFVREPRWWERPAAYLIGALLLMITLLSAHRIRIRYWKKEAIRFESSAAEKETVLRAVREREAHFSALLDHASDAIFLLDASGTISYVSSSTERLTSRPSVALLGKRLVDLIHPEDRAAVRAALDNIRSRPRRPTTFRYRLEVADTGWRTFSAIGRNLLDEKVVSGIIVNARDVTEQEQAETLFRQSQKMEAIGQLVGGIAHDFNNLLTVMTVSSSMLLDRIAPDDGRRADVQEIRDATERAAALTNQLLVFSRKQVMQPRNIRLNDLIRNVQRLLGRLIGDDIEFSTALDEDLAAIHADPGQIEQVLINLVVNARDAMPEGGKIRVATSNVELADQHEGRRVGAPAGAYVLLSVSDTGTGMTPAVLERLFEPFFTTKEQGKGTGLGLSTVHGIVKQSGGDLWVYSEIGQGTTFKVYFPALSSDIPRETEHTPGQPVKRGRETVLLVEDDAKLILLSARILEGLGYTVMLARNGREALDIIAAHGDRIDVVLTDVVMPVMSGRPLIEKLREIMPKMRFLFMSGYTADEVTRRGILDGQSPFLQKPFTPEQLGWKIREVLDQPARE